MAVLFLLVYYNKVPRPFFLYNFWYAIGLQEVVPSVHVVDEFKMVKIPCHLFA